ncbi:MAG: hypothetical protein GY928_39080 [Colwellia sp.]|nr:hypothetical protein [Colwellia sp.]
MCRDPAEKRHKLGIEYTGPYKIVDLIGSTATIVLCENQKLGNRRVNIDRLSPLPENVDIDSL